jgi:Asp-tRNA(Asn)/Glu-tRNA(Gln) amidotransferase A subunit family amidase
MDDIAKKPARAYDPANPGLRPFHSEIAKFVSGALTPRAYLELCLEQVDARESEIKAFTAMDKAAARKAADAATARYKAGKPLSIVDGMPIAVKDVIETEDLPTAHGSQLFKGNQPTWDAACVYWLRKGGAYVLGKTVTTEFATQPPGPTRNPWDITRTPGGSSSGSAAAVGAGMAPLGLGTQVRGSVLRPACYCGLYGMKGTFGVITNQGILPVSRGINHLGMLASTLEDAWLTLHYISRTAGGEPGHASLPGKTEMPAAHKPARLVKLDTIAWPRVTPETQRVFDGMLDKLRAQGVEIITRKDSPQVERFESLIAGIMEVSDGIRDWEARYPMMPYYDRDKSKLEPVTVERIEKEIRAATPESYETALRRRREMQAAYAALSEISDGCITLTVPAPAPKGMPTGDASFLDAFSVIGMPALTLPLLSVEALPVGIHLSGFDRADARLVAVGRWMSELALPGAK